MTNVVLPAGPHRRWQLAHIRGLSAAQAAGTNGLTDRPVPAGTGNTPAWLERTHMHWRPATCIVMGAYLSQQVLTRAIDFQPPCASHCL